MHIIRNVYIVDSIWNLDTRTRQGLERTKYTSPSRPLAPITPPTRADKSVYQMWMSIRYIYRYIDTNKRTWCIISYSFFSLISISKLQVKTCNLQPRLVPKDLEWSKHFYFLKKHTVSRSCVVLMCVQIDSKDNFSRYSGNN